MGSPKKKPCPDCGEYPVNHAAQWVAVLLETASIPFFAPLDALMYRAKPRLQAVPFDRLALSALRALTFLRLGTMKTKVDERDSHRNQLLWEASEKRGVAMHHFRLLDRNDGVNFFVARVGKDVRAFEGLPKPKRTQAPSVAWMDDKGILKKKLTAAGIPMAKGRACRTFAQAQKTMHEVGTPVITKPSIGSRARHATLHITNEAELERGFAIAKQVSPWAIVEQELQGDLFRVTLVNGKVAAIVRREPPRVTGDGEHTVRELVQTENKDPRRDGRTFHKIVTNELADHELARQKLSWESVPKKGAIVTLHSYISRFYGGATADFTEHVHPENTALFEHIGRVLDDSLVGIDFIIGDMERSWREQKLCGVIECNSLPNIDLHHDVLYGKNRDIAGLLIELTFPQLKDQKSL